ncbi:MAG: glycosyltransferase family protein [Lutibacter sp.]
MKIFIPAPKDGNTFFDEIMFHSNNTFVFDNFKNYNAENKIVVIHWPEQIFDWNEPSMPQLKELKEAIEIWKKLAKIIYVVHNLERHYGMTANFKKLYNLIESSCDTMIHFGNYSFELFKNKYPNITHKVISHPLYEESFTLFDKEEARKKLGIDEESLVILVPGRIRKIFERKMVLRAFKKLPQKNKVLLATNMMKFKFPYEFKGRDRLKSFFDIKNVYENYFKNKVYKKPKYYFNYNYLSSHNFSLMLSAADVIFIPRKQILNSGNVFLGLTYKKIIVGPNQGNIKEVLDIFGFPSFDPNNPKSVSVALRQSIIMLKDGSYCYDDAELAKFKPKNVAEEWDKLIENLSQN